MIDEFLRRFDANRNELRKSFKEKQPSDYKDLVTRVIKVLSPEDDYDEFAIDPTRIVQIDHGDYQGTLVYVIGDKTYQPSDYWYVKVSYGSCSGCDTLQHIEDMTAWDDNTVTEEQADDYMTLALHIVQGLKKMDDIED